MGKMPIDKLDSYERELCESEDPADHTALLMRLLLKKNGVDPDECEVINHGFDFSGCDVVSEQCFVRDHYIQPSLPCYVSLKTKVTQHGKFVEVKGDAFLNSLLFGTDPWKEFLAKVDGEVWTVTSIGPAGEGTLCLQLQETTVDEV